MSGNKKYEKNASLSHSQLEVLEVGAELHEYGFTFWGHGTIYENVESFFQKGLFAHHADITSTAIPIDKSNVSRIDNWQLGVAKATKIVLLAVPDASPTEGVTALQVLEYIFEDDQNNEDKYCLPPRYIVGVYDPIAKSVVLNPGFALLENSHQESIESIRNKRDHEQEMFIGRKILNEHMPISTPAGLRTENLKQKSPDVW